MFNFQIFENSTIPADRVTKRIDYLTGIVEFSYVNVRRLMAFSSQG